MTIAVVGGLNIDYVTISDRLPREGEMLRASSFAYSPGGKGQNYAIGCARLLQNCPSKKQTEGSEGKLGVPTPQNPLGISVKMIGCVGSDHWGPELLRRLDVLGVDCQQVAVKQGLDTGVVLITVDAGTGQNRLIGWSAANYALQPRDLASLPTPLPQILHVTLEVPLPTILHVMRLAKASRVRVMFNPSPMLKEPLPAELYTLVTDLVMNEEETEKLSGAEEKGISIRHDLLETARTFLDKGVVTAIITLGPDGYFYATDGGKEHGSEKGLEVKAVDATSAGDTFLAAYTLAIIRGATIGAACSWANKCAAVTVQRPNAGESQPWKDEAPDLAI